MKYSASPNSYFIFSLTVIASIVLVGLSVGAALYDSALIILVVISSVGSVGFLFYTGLMAVVYYKCDHKGTIDIVKITEKIHDRNNRSFIVSNDTIKDFKLIVPEEIYDNYKCGDEVNIKVYNGYACIDIKNPSGSYSSTKEC